MNATEKTPFLPIRALMKRLRWPVLVFFLCVASHDAALADGNVEPVAANWRAAGEIPLKIRKAEASGSLSEQYAPERICDNDRRTKWVCPVRPSMAAPQWVSITLAGGPQAITRVAVFGERVDNDGIVDAGLQIKSSGEFKTVASVRNATSAAWVARLDGAVSDQVRLLVQRSGGPTDHTDVWEIEVYGRPPTVEELRARLPEALEQLRRTTKTIEDTGVEMSSLPAPFRAALDSASNCFKRLSDRQNESASASRQSLVQDLTELAEADAPVGQIAARLAKRASALSHRKELLARAQAMASPTVAALSNDTATVWFEPAARLNVMWRDTVPVSIVGAGFSAEINGANAANAIPELAIKEFNDSFGTGQGLQQTWRNGGVRIEREVRFCSEGKALSIGGRIVNESAAEVRLGTVRLLDIAGPGGWNLGSAWEAPAAIYIQSYSLLQSRPFTPQTDFDAGPPCEYRGSGVLAFAGRNPSAAFVIGYLRADDASPDLAATFRVDEGGTALSATSRFMGRVLGPGETIELNRLYLAAEPDFYHALEAYGEAMAQSGPEPARTGPTSLWCSWYAHRMGMTEEKVLANAAVAARHFQPLGLEIMQLDHGWQRSDVTGDWVPNERFPHGLRWLADELKRRHGLRLGLWIAPTDAAETSEVFRQHPDWMLRGDDGKPRVNWRWYWAPNPNCHEVDATHPEAYRNMVGTFRRLSAEGASYYKIDFIAASGGEQFIQHDPKATRGWSPLQRAMKAIREGAGKEAWIRYCQIPPVLGAGLASSVIGANDTLDAGVPGRFDVLIESVQALAAGWWLNDRPYHREVCDMSVRMQGSIEEVRVRAALMTLANCSISWSDELCYLPPSRIRLMQQCMPPGNPPMRPIDIFDRAIPSVWHLKMTNAAGAWDVVGLFNMERRPEKRAVRFADLGLDPTAQFAVFEFWEERFLGILRDGVELLLPPESSRVLSIRRVTGVPQLVGTDMHLLQGWHEVKQLEWNGQTGMLSGRYERMPGISGKAFFRVPPGYSPKFQFPLGPESARLTHVEGELWMQEIEFAEKSFSWSIPFEAPSSPQGKEPIAP